MLVQLEIGGFRNLEPLDWSIASGSHLILGSNGAGKTSLLEAIYLLATTRSFRTPRIADCARHGTRRFSLRGEIDSGWRTRLEVEWNEGHRERLINGSQGSLAEHLAVLPVVCWTASDSELLTGPPASRRRFLDRGILGRRPAAIETLSRYRRALQEKRQLLQRGGGELEVWNQVLAEPAAEIISQRTSYVQSLRLCLESILEECRLGLGNIEIRYRSSLRRGLEGTSAIVEELMAASGRELALGQPILGPHRDDLVIRWDGHELRRVASAGERKAIGLALVAAHGRVVAESGRDSVFLLDDADTELDGERLKALWRVLGSQRQLLATSNRPKIWEDVEIDSRWFCRSGHLRSGTDC